MSKIKENLGISNCNANIELFWDEDEIIYLKKAQELFHQKSYDGSIIFCKKALEIGNKSNNAKFLLGLNYSRLQMTEEALEIFIDLDDEIEFYNDLVVNLTHLSIAKEQYKQVIKRYETQWKSHENQFNELVFNNIGVAYQRLSQLTKADYLFNKALEINPESSYALKNLAITYVLNKDFEKGKIIYKKYIKLFPEDIEGILNLVSICIELKEHDNCEVYLDKALELSKNNPQDLNYIGKKFINIKRLDKAEKIFNELLEIEDISIQSHYNLACIYAIKENPEASIDHLTIAIEKNEDSSINIREMAKSDSDFDKIKSHPKFQKLIN